MQIWVKTFAAIAVGTILASCAPKPEPIMPEPVYDKYGTIVVNECRPSTVPVSPNYPERLPICEEECPPGTMQNPNANASPTLPQCIPINEGSDGGGRQSPNNPNP
jgi:hypothetical protein